MRSNKNRPGSPGRTQTQNPMQPTRADQPPGAEREEEEEEESDQRREEDEESPSIGQADSGMPSSNRGSPGNQGHRGPGS